jgi:hypothetical protein
MREMSGRAVARRIKAMQPRPIRTGRTKTAIERVMDSQVSVQRLRYLPLNILKSFVSGS